MRRSCASTCVRTLPPAELRYAEVCELDTRIGQAFAEVAAECRSRPRGPVDLVCSHGQTVFHWVAGAHALGTLQLGEPAWIAERTGAPGGRPMSGPGTSRSAVTVRRSRRSWTCCCWAALPGSAGRRSTWVASPT